MSVNYDALLTNEQKRSIVSQRIAQFAAEAYQYSLNKKTAEKLGSEEQIEQINKQIELIDAAIAIHEEELATLPTE
jgi:hypothetical protein